MTSQMGVVAVLLLVMLQLEATSTSMAMLAILATLSMFGLDCCSLLFRALCFRYR